MTSTRSAALGPSAARAPTAFKPGRVELARNPFPDLSSTARSTSSECVCSTIDHLSRIMFLWLAGYSNDHAATISRVDVKLAPPYYGIG